MTNLSKQRILIGLGTIFVSLWALYVMSLGWVETLNCNAAEKSCTITWYDFFEKEIQKRTVLVLQEEPKDERIDAERKKYDPGYRNIIYRYLFKTHEEKAAFLKEHGADTYPHKNMYFLIYANDKAKNGWVAPQINEKTRDAFYSFKYEKLDKITSKSSSGSVGMLAFICLFLIPVGLLSLIAGIRNKDEFI